MKQNTFQSLNRQKGVSLIEVLVTTLILGVGLLGTAALQVTSINSNQEGYYRSQASMIAKDIASRMRTAKLAIYDANAPTTVNDVISEYVGAPLGCGTAPVMCTSSACTPSQVAGYDKYEMCLTAENELPEGEVFIVNAAGNRAQIAVAWTPTAARRDLGQFQIINNSCAALGVAATKDCVILETIP